jgi:hypothetical protein
MGFILKRAGLMVWVLHNKTGAQVFSKEAIE